MRFSFAIPRALCERHGAPAGHRGLELVREGVPTPFSPAVILPRTTPGAPLVVADHDPGATRGRHDRLFGMALDVDADPRRPGCASAVPKRR